jgi:O-antigen/teichoic acid export membrane protein
MIIFSRKLNYDDYGKFQSVWMYTNIVNVIINFGLSAVILSTNINFLFSFIKKNQKRLSIFYSLLWISGLTVFFFFAKNFDTSLKFLLIAFMVIQNVSSVVETLLIKRQGEKISFTINCFYSILFFIWHLYILFTNYSLYFLISGICIISILKLVVMILIPSKNESYEETLNEKHFLNHWIYLGLNDVVGIISKWMDKAFLLYLLTTTDFAIFFNGSFEIPLFGLLISVTGSFLLIEISRNLHLSNKIIKLFRENFNALSAIVFPLFFFLFFFQKELFSFVFNDKYNASLPIFAISIFILPIRINNYSTILQCFSEGKKILWGSVLDIFIAIILMLILYPIMHTKGIALAIVIATYCQVLYYLWHSAKILHTSILEIVPFKKLILKFFGFLFLFTCLFFLLSEATLKTKLFISIPFTGIIILAGILPYLKFFSKKK